MPGPDESITSLIRWQGERLLIWRRNECLAIHISLSHSNTLMRSKYVVFWLVAWRVPHRRTMCRFHQVHYSLLRSNYFDKEIQSSRRKVIDLIWRSAIPYQLDPFDYMLEPFCVVPWKQTFSRIIKECWTREGYSQEYRKNAELVNANVAEVQIMLPVDDPGGLKEDIDDSIWRANFESCSVWM